MGFSRTTHSVQLIQNFRKGKYMTRLAQRFRSAISGEYVKQGFAKSQPKITVRETGTHKKVKDKK